MMYANWEYYNAFYGGKTIEETDFPRLARMASRYIDYITMGKARRMPESDAVREACCALADQYWIINSAEARATAEHGEMQSQSVGDYSVTYRSGLDTAEIAKKELGTIAKQYLSGTGLLYRGGARCTRHTL